MKRIALACALALAATPAYAQFGRVTDALSKADKAKKTIDSLTISDADERKIGAEVSTKLIDRFGVYQDAAVAKYVALVGTVLAQASARPNLDWKFIVLDTEGVNAYAAPGGFVHITKGALGLIKSEAELAGVLGHEIVHITAKHTINAIKKAKLVDAGTDAAGSAAGGLSGELVNRLAGASYTMVFENKLDRNDENESDKDGAVLANKVGYAPSGIADFLNHLLQRNAGRAEQNGLFASHPDTKDRVSRNARIIREQKLTATATGRTRYAATVKFDAKPVTEIAVVESGAKGVAGSEGKPAAEKKEEPKKGSRFGGLTSALSGNKQAESTQASASGAGRAVDKTDNHAPGGSNKNPVRISITPADIAEFKKGIA